MPITSSAKKAWRQNLAHRDRNRKQKTALKKVIKAYTKSLAAKTQNETKQQLHLVYQALDKAAKTGVIKRGTADRLKSRLSKKLK